jgi:hypothetical protein
VWVAATVDIRSKSNLVIVAFCINLEQRDTDEEEKVVVVWFLATFAFILRYRWTSHRVIQTMHWM